MSSHDQNGDKNNGRNGDYDRDGRDGGGEGFGPWGYDPESGQGGDPSPIVDAELLSDVESDYVTRWMAYDRQQRAGEAADSADLLHRRHIRADRPSTVVVLRQSAMVARRQGAELVRRSVIRTGIAAGMGWAVVLRVVAWVVGRVAAGWRAAPVVQARAVAGYRVRKVPVDVLRLSWFVLRGNARWVGKAWTFFTYADLRADARTARASGDPEARRKAQELLRADSRARWARLATALETTRRVGTVVAVAVGVLWLINATIDRADMWPWLAGVYDALSATAQLATDAGPVVLAALAAAWAVASAMHGRDRTPGAGFLIRPDRDDAESWIDERMISQALAHLGIGPVDRFVKNGGQLQYTVPARVDGDGTFAQIRLPLGATADMVADRSDRLAANLGRAKLETWPTEGPEAGLLDLWIANKGKLGRGPGAWPLLHDGRVDVFAGVPFGRSQRGTLVLAPILERNYLIGGQPGQGKSSAGRTLCLGCVLDPTVELRVFVFATNPDFDPFRPRLSQYVKSDDDEAIAAGVAELRALRDDVTRRGELLEQRGASKVTRSLASTVSGLHPKVVVFDECHEMFEHPKHGEEARTLAVKVVKKARKCGITLVFLTQSPTAASIPKDLTRNCSNGVAFAVADQVANDGLLGSGKYRQGIRATELRPGEDRGTAVTVGLTGNRFELIGTFYVAFDEDRDDVTPVINRAMELLAGDGLPAISEPEETTPETVVDHLTDIRAVLGDEVRLRTQVVIRRLADLNPSEYGDWSFPELAEALDDAGISIRKSDGVKVVRAADVMAALARRTDDYDEAADDGDAAEDAGDDD